MVNGIDNPILVQRTSDYVRDNSALIRRTEVMQDAASRLSHEQFEAQARFVVDVETAQEKTVDKDGARKGDQERKPRILRKRKNADELGSLPVGEGEAHRIDIEI